MSPEPMEKVFVVKSVNVFDPDIAYIYSDALAEFDYLVIRDENNAYIIESVSKEEEECLNKLVRNTFLSPSLPPVYWSRGSKQSSRQDESRQGSHGPCGEQGFLHNPPLSVEEADHLAMDYRFIWEPVYRDATEIANLILYTRLFMPHRFRKYVYKDFENLETLGNEDNEKRVLLRKITTFAEAVYTGKIREDHESTYSASDSGFTELHEKLSHVDSFILMIQFGISHYRLYEIVKQLYKFIAEEPSPWRNRLSALKFIIALNEKLLQQHRGEIEEIAESLRAKFSTENVYLCLLKEDRDGPICSGSVDRLGEGDEQDNNPFKAPSGDYLVMVFQDWSKRYFEAWIRYLQSTGRRIYVAIAPEVGYYYETSSGSRLVNMYYKFHSIENRKVLIFEWGGGNA